MLALASKPVFKGNVEVVETRPYYPAELGVLNSLFIKRKLNNKELLQGFQQACGGKGKYKPPYLGTASFFLLTGNEMGERLAKMMDVNDR